MANRRNIIYRGGSAADYLKDAVQKDDLVCFKSELYAMGRPVCAPVYRNPDGKAETYDEYVLLGGVWGEAFEFSVTSK